MCIGTSTCINTLDFDINFTFCIRRNPIKVNLVN